MREKLMEFIEYGEGREIRMELHEIAKRDYKPKHSDEYISFMNEHPVSFDINHAQSQNFPYYFTMLSIPSQHVMGDCVEECLDKAIELSGWNEK